MLPLISLFVIGSADEDPVEVLQVGSSTTLVSRRRRASSSDDKQIEERCDAGYLRQFQNGQSCIEGATYDGQYEGVLWKMQCRRGRLCLEEVTYRDGPCLHIPGLTKSWDVSAGIFTLLVGGGLGNQMHQMAMLLSVLEEARCDLPFFLRRTDVTEGRIEHPTYFGTVFHSMRPIVRDVEFLGGEGFFAEGDEGAIPPHCVVKESWDDLASQFTFSHFLGVKDDPSLPTQLSKSLRSLRLEQREFGCLVIALLGNFVSQNYFMKHFSLIRESFWHEKSVSIAQQVLANLTRHISTHSTVVAIHVRQLSHQDRIQQGTDKDKQQRNALREYILHDYYLRAMHEVRRLAVHSDLTCLVFSNAPLHEETAGQLSDCNRRLDVPADVDEVTCLYMMSLARILVITLSMYSYWAALLGPHKLVVFPEILSADGRFTQLGFSDWRHNRERFGWAGIPVNIDGSAGANFSH